MAVLKNLANETTATTGTGTITLGGAVTGYLTFAQAGVQNGDQVTYGIRDGNEAEVGRGTWDSSLGTLTRDTVLRSTGAGNTAKINLSGSAQVRIVDAAEDHVRTDAAQTWTGAQRFNILRITDDQGAGGQYVSFRINETLTSNRALDFILGDAHRSITLQGNVTIPAGTLAALGDANTWTAAQTIDQAPLIINRAGGSGSSINFNSDSGDSRASIDTTGTPSIRLRSFTTEGGATIGALLNIIGGTGVVNVATGTLQQGGNDVYHESGTDVAVADGGTGASTASGARTNLGLGSIATVNSPVPVANGGTNATSAADARSNLGAAGFSTASAAGATNFPVGHTLIVVTEGASLNRNVALNVHLNSINSTQYVNGGHSDAGTQLSGDWRASGQIGLTGVYQARRVG